MNAPHSCPYCVESVADLVKASNILANVLKRPQAIGQPGPAALRAAQHAGIRSDFDAINACVAARHLAEFPLSGLDK